MGQYKRRADAELVARLHYTISKLSQVSEQYEDAALPDTRVLSNLSIVKALVSDVERQMRARL